MVAGVANVGLGGAVDRLALRVVCDGNFPPFAPHIVVVAGLQGAAGIDEFPDAAEVVFRVEQFVERCGCGGGEDALCVVLLEDGSTCGVAFFGGLAASGPEVAFVGEDGAGGSYLGDSDAAGEAVVGELSNAVVGVGDLDQAVLGVPIVDLAGAVGGGVAVEVVAGAAGGAGDVDRVWVGARISVGTGVRGLDGDAVGSGGGRHPAGEYVPAIGGGGGEGVGIGADADGGGFVGGAAHAHPAAGLFGDDLVAVVVRGLSDLRAVLAAGAVADLVVAKGVLLHHGGGGVREGGGLKLVGAVVGDAPGFGGGGAGGL